MKKCYLSLGSNLGDRSRTLREALGRLSSAEQVSLVKNASFYATKPWGKTDQPDFLNTAAVVETELEPLALLKVCQQIEHDLGRVRHEHWGARTIDIDIIHIDGMQSEDEELLLPHPFFAARMFVLVPLCEIAPDTVIKGKTVSAWLEELKAQGEEMPQKAAELASPFPLKMIACADRAGGIGFAGNLLAKIPEDMAYFKQMTMHSAVIMGRKTWESLPGEHGLAGRINIVLSRNTAVKGADYVCRDESSLLGLLARLQQEGTENFWCIGGGEIYRALLPLTKEIHLTRLAEKYEADTFFPPLPDFLPAGKKQGKNVSWELYRRKGFCVSKHE